MSKTLITQYYNRLDKLIQFGGTREEKVIDLLKRVCTVSVESVRIVNKMEKAN